MIKSFIMAHTKAVILAAACAVAAAIAIPTGIHVYSANHNAPGETVTAKKDSKSEENQDKKQEKKEDKKSSDAKDSAEQSDAENADAATSETANAEKSEQDKNSASAKNTAGTSKANAGTASNGKTQSSAQSSQPATQQTAQPAAQNTQTAAVPAQGTASYLQAGVNPSTGIDETVHEISESEMPASVKNNVKEYVGDRPITFYGRQNIVDPNGKQVATYLIGCNEKIPVTNHQTGYTDMADTIIFNENGDFLGYSGGSAGR